MKKRIRKTGEIVDVIAWYNLMGAERDMNDSVSYIDSKGNECVKMEKWQLKSSKTKKIWKKRIKEILRLTN